MIKSFAIGAAATAVALAPMSALAGPYFNPEFNGSTYAEEYLGGVLTMDIGYEGGGEGFSWYVQGGPAAVMPEGADNEVEFAGKFGGSVVVDAAEEISVYGELSGITGDDFGWGSKLGAKYAF